MKTTSRTRSTFVSAGLAGFLALGLAAGALAAPAKGKGETTKTQPAMNDPHAGSMPAGMPAMSPEDMAMMQACIEAGTPGAGHESLEPLIGNWNAETTMWMKPGAPGMTSKGSSEAKWILDGRYLQETFEGDMMGTPFRGLGLTGYDNVQGRFVGTWADSMSTGIMSTIGDATEDGKRMTFWGSYWDPVTKRPAMMRETLAIESPDRHVMAMYMTNPSTQEEYKSMEIVFTRQLARTGQ